MTILLDGSMVCVTAPAGTGKTHLLAESIKAYRGDKPVLVLTHTNAGVQALRKRLEQAQVTRRLYALGTIDGFALQLVRTFPLRTGHTLDLSKINYAEMRKGAVRLLEEQHIDTVLRANFARVLVDEYQDCESMQHRIVCSLARLVPTCVLGDPLQRIFTFKGAVLPSWNTVQSVFSEHHVLAEPFRWIKAGNADLGHWLLSLRPALLKKEPISLDGAPDNGLLHLPRTNSVPSGAPFSDFMPVLSSLTGSTLIIGSSVNVKSRHDLARHLPGASIIEPVDMKSLLEFADSFDACILRNTPDAPSALACLLDFAANVMTGVQEKNIIKRLGSIGSGKNTKPPDAHELVAIQFSHSPSYILAADLLDSLHSLKGARLFRPQVFRAFRTALNMVAEGKVSTLVTAATECRERNRDIAMSLPKVAIGSTLLLKGLEADNVFVQDADGISAENIYVALTRGSKQIVVRSKSKVLTPQRP